MTSPTTDAVDLGALVVPGGYFVHRASAPGRTPFHPNAVGGNGHRHSYTYVGGGSTSRTDALDLIDSARRKVFVASFFVGDTEVREALCRAAERLRGGVYVISAMTERDLNRAINDVDEQEQIDQQIEHKRFEELTRHGIAVRAYEGCHAKFIVVDDRAALVSSANLTTSGLDTTGENGILVDAPDDVDRVARFFAVLWHGSRWQMEMTGEPVVTVNTAPSRPVLLPPPAPGTVGPIWTLPDQRHIADAIADLIGGAATELLLATFSLDGMTKRPDLLLDHVASAIDRGVHVRLLLRGRNNVPAHSADAAALAALGVELYPCRLNHAKGVIADRTRGALFSANFDASHGLDRDVELGMRLDGTPALGEALRYFEHAIAEHDLDYVRDPAGALLAERLHSYQVDRWPLAVTADVVAEDHDWARLVELRDGPVLFSGASDDLKLHAQRWTWRLAAGRLSRLDDRRRDTASQQLTAWLTERRSTQRRPADARGICAATFHRTHES
jgi:phosphatidylserine/phosphatidylglycerophosphate/cardiolipin synthase-like enzyme